MYYLLLIVLYPLSLLPLRVLYILSDLLYVVAYYITDYRKPVVWDNLKHAFPEKTDAELRKIRKAYYHSFCDQWIETLKLLSISKEQLNKRIIGNWEVFAELDKEGLNSYAMLGHTFNWEWACVATQYNCKQQFAGVFMPTEQKGFDRLLSQVRTRGGGWLISMKAKKAFQRLQGVRYIVGLIADQNPSNMNGTLWAEFMHREAPFFKGPEQLARRNKAAVVFAGIKKIRRGYYEVNLELVTKDASIYTDSVITQDYIAFMEKQIREQPENWMWTHKRWKYSKND